MYDQHHRLALELAMSMMGLSIITVRSRRLPVWSELRALFIEWRQRARSRHDLMKLSERDLSDMGLNATGRVQRDLQAVLGSVVSIQFGFLWPGLPPLLSPL
jgi:uncharacterized protein YjiS (DUF1127 family)